MFYKDKNFFEDYKSVGWIPNWNFCKADNQNAQELVFLLDNLTEMVNPIFRSFGVQLFFDKVNVYRYYYRTNLDYNLIIASPKKDMKIDFFEHIIKSENLDKSKVYVEKDGILSVVDMVSLKQDIKEKINEIKKSEKFDKEYVIKQIFSAFEYEISEQQKGFLNSPFPKEIKEFYIQTCKLPVEKLEKGISKVLGVDEK